MTIIGTETPEVLARLEMSRRRALRELLPGELSGLDTLDLGCGSGDFIGLLVSEGLDPARLEGIDQDPERIARAAARFPEARFRIHDLRTAQVAPHRADLVVLSQVLSQIPEKQARRDLLSLAATALRPRGRILIHDMIAVRPRSRKKGVTRFGPDDLLLVLPERFTVRNFRRCTLLPPLLRLTARHMPFVADRLESVTALRGHWMTLLEEAGCA